MKQTTHPYQQYKNSPTWKSLSRSIGKLVANGDLQQQTDRGHIVGFLCAELAKVSAKPSAAVPAKSSGSPTPRRRVAASQAV